MTKRILTDNPIKSDSGTRFDIMSDFHNIINGIRETLTAEVFLWITGVRGKYSLPRGSVLDYIRYKSIQDAKDTGAITVNREETDEIPNRGTDYKGTEYR